MITTTSRRAPGKCTIPRQLTARCLPATSSTVPESNRSGSTPIAFVMSVTEPRLNPGTCSPKTSSKPLPMYKKAGYFNDRATKKPATIQINAGRPMNNAPTAKIRRGLRLPTPPAPGSFSPIDNALSDRTPPRKPACDRFPRPLCCPPEARRSCLTGIPNFTTASGVIAPSPSTTSSRGSSSDRRRETA